MSSFDQYSVFRRHHLSKIASLLVYLDFSLSRYSPKQDPLMAQMLLHHLWLVFMRKGGRLLLFGNLARCIL